MATSRLVGPCSQMHSWAHAAADLARSSSQVCRGRRNGTVRVRGGCEVPHCCDASYRGSRGTHGRFWPRSLVVCMSPLSPSLSNGSGRSAKDSEEPDPRLPSKLLLHL